MGVQIQTATRDGQGNPLSILSRQFISFSYGGKNIEDFDLIAIFESDRLSKELYASFKDITTEQDELDGQLFWGSNFSAGQLNFSLATDGIDSKQLEDFKNWFKPGTEKELILSEYHNRGILARVGSAPQMSLLPFEKEVEVQIGSEKRKTKVSLYKGNISLSFVMDDPHWYSLKSYLETLTEEDVKIFYEDKVPYKEMFKTSCLLADDYICDENLIITNKTNGIALSGKQQKDGLLYYCGSAPEKPIISFKITPIIDEVSGKISFDKSDSSKNYYLSIGVDNNYQQLDFNLPSLFSSYNTAIDKVLEYKEGSSILDLRKELRDTLYNYSTRSYVMAIIDFARLNKNGITAEGAIQSSFQSFFINQMKNFFKGDLECIINNKTGEVLISGIINLYNGEGLTEDNLLSTTSTPITENAGNMIKSNYLTIEAVNLPNTGWIESINCLFIKTNTELFDLKINYKYRYL
jgi:hypothetical protein